MRLALNRVLISSERIQVVNMMLHGGEAVVLVGIQSLDSVEESIYALDCRKILQVSHLSRQYLY